MGNDVTCPMCEGYGFVVKPDQDIYPRDVSLFSLQIKIGRWIRDGKLPRRFGASHRCRVCGGSQYVHPATSAGWLLTVDPREIDGNPI